MGTVSPTVIVDFEVYVLMTMKPRLKMSQKLDQLEAKLAAHGFTQADGEHVHARVARALGDEATFFGNLAKLLGAQREVTSLTFRSALWPEFAFEASTGEGGRTVSAQYRRTDGATPDVAAPVGQPVWSLDVDEFAAHFGPLTLGRQWPLFDESLPNYAEHEFVWNGWRWGAGFSWGLFMFAAEFWE
jgi:hypothetical protein